MFEELKIIFKNIKAATDKFFLDNWENETFINRYKLFLKFSLPICMLYGLYLFEILPDFFYFKTDGTRYINFKKYVVSRYFLYWWIFLYHFYSFFIYNFIDIVKIFFSLDINSLFNDNAYLVVYNKLTIRHGNHIIGDYYEHHYNYNYFRWRWFVRSHYDYYLYTYRYWRINIINTNTPWFLYFGIFFLISNIISILFLSYLGLYGVFIINLITILFFWGSSIMYFENFFLDNISYKIVLFKWFFINYNKWIYFELLIDPISYSFMFLTLTISIFVYIYAFSYFRYEPNVERLIILINFFVISMICLVLSGNIFVLFLGWELIGLTSFFLINFWSTRISTLKAAFKAFSFNKLSDVSLLIAILIIYFIINDINILTINNNISVYNNYYLNILNNEISIIEILSFFLVLCSFVKSAQFGFHLWLPDSMEAPVPASALIHSATLVSAGVFVLLRFVNLFEYSYYSYYVVPIVGSFTALFGGVCSMYQSDVKKILAYSTISHCGFLMVCFSMYISEYTILYLYIHGFFKAAVFLCVGNIIRFSKNYQDFRRMGGFWKYLPFECFSSFICLINLSGLPFTIGFYIKHLLIIGFYFNNFFKFFIITNIICAAITGLFYSYRLFYYVFFDFKKAKKIVYTSVNKENLFSLYYSNTSLISNFTIFFFIITSYSISLYLFELFLNKNSLGEGLFIYSLTQVQFFEFINISLNLVNNIFYFNLLIIIFIIVIIFSSWRKIFNNVYIFNLFIFLLNFYIFYIFFIFI